ncbi:MAG TPA: hypothetical protein VFB36_17125 [Nevskiaceae bacterium]|nr:hypothetical protein [Nevskiaceae bacterium]
MIQINAASGPAAHSCGTSSQQGDAMSRIQTAFKNELQLLSLLRDEVKLHTHLLKADVRKRFDELERRWAELQAQIARAEVAGANAGEDARAGVKKLIETLRAGYEQISKALKAPA